MDGSTQLKELKKAVCGVVVCGWVRVGWDAGVKISKESCDNTVTKKKKYAWQGNLKIFLMNGKMYASNTKIKYGNILHQL